MIAIVAAGVYMVSKNTDSLVESDYYEQGINFDEVYLRRQNLLTHKAQPEVRISGDSLQIRFKHQGNEGQLYLFRPSEKALDTRIPFSVDGDYFWTDIGALKTGSWELQLIWQSGEHDFQYDRMLYLD